jgi:hypothetical protein
MNDSDLRDEFSPAPPYNCPLYVALGLNVGPSPAGPSACEYLGFNGNQAPRRAGEHVQSFFPARQQHFASTQFFGCDACYVNQFPGVEDVSFLAYGSKLPTHCVQLLPALRLRQPLQKLPLLPSSRNSMIR